MKNQQIEYLRKKYEDNVITYDEIGMLFSAIDTLSQLYEQYRLKEECRRKEESFKKFIIKIL